MCCPTTYTTISARAAKKQYRAIKPSRFLQKQSQDETSSELTLLRFVILVDSSTEICDSTLALLLLPNYYMKLLQRKKEVFFIV